MAPRREGGSGRRTTRHTPEGLGFTELVLEVFRLNGLLIAAGNELSANSGLTSARWQVLGAIALATTPLSVANIARAMGLTRQGVQRVVDELERGGLVRRTEDPASLKARPVELTPAGQAAYEDIMARQRPWANQTAAGSNTKQLTAAVAVLREIRQRLERTARGRRQRAAHATRKEAL